MPAPGCQPLERCRIGGPLMEQAASVSIHRGDDGRPFGFVLGADWVGQHEHGIEGIHALLGIGSTVPGISRRSMRSALPQGAACIAHAATDERAWVEISACPASAGALEASGNDIAAAWAEDGFRLVATGRAEREAVKDLTAAVHAGDLAAYLGGGFDARGLVLLIVSCTPEAIKQEMMQHDLDKDRLASAALSTGIAERLKAADSDEYGLLRTHGWFALSPAWRDEASRMGQPLETAHEVVFFLNPVHQDRFESGWFTVEELDAWTRGEGPVLRAMADPRMQA